MVSLSAPTFEREGGQLVVSATIESPKHSGERLWFRVPEHIPVSDESAADALFAIGLIIAMASDRVLDLKAPVSRKLVAASHASQNILTMWHPKALQRATLTVRERGATPVRPRGLPAASCFTGGADSFHTLVANDERIATLLFVHGLDIPLAEHALRSLVSGHLTEVASETGKAMVEIATNARELTDHYVSWGLIAHGPVLASVAHLLAGTHAEVLIPSSHTYADRYPWGSDPLLDHLWSSEDMSVVHDGAGKTRVDKLVAISELPVARKHLRVCWNITGEYNCGQCEKCLRTMTTLKIAGALQEFETFAHDVSPDDIGRQRLKKAGDFVFAKENLEFARSKGNQQFVDVLVKVLAPRPSERDEELLARIGSLEKRIDGLESSTRRLGSLWPIRTWTRLARWRRRGRGRTERE